VCRGRGTVEMGSVSFGTEWQVMETTYTVGVVAASMPRCGMYCGELILGMPWRVDACRCMLDFGTTIVLARRPIDAAVVGSGELVFGELVCGKACRVLVSFSTTPVQARFPIDAGGVGLTMSRPGNAGTVVVSCGLSMRVYQPSSCRHGAGSTPAAWGGLRQGPVGCGSLRSVWTRSGGAGQGCARFGGAWNEKHHADGAVPASTLDGGMRLDVARLGKARRVESRPGVVTPPS
jgi:hypothetical protein